MILTQSLFSFATIYREKRNGKLKERMFKMSSYHGMVKMMTKQECRTILEVELRQNGSVQSLLKTLNIPEGVYLDSDKPYFWGVTLDVPKILNLLEDFPKIDLVDVLKWGPLQFSGWLEHQREAFGHCKDVTNIFELLEVLNGFQLREIDWQNLPSTRSRSILDVDTGLSIDWNLASAKKYFHGTICSNNSLRFKLACRAFMIEMYLENRAKETKRFFETNTGKWVSSIAAMIMYTNSEHRVASPGKQELDNFCEILDRRIGKPQPESMLDRLNQSIYSLPAVGDSTTSPQMITKDQAFDILGESVMLDVMRQLAPGADLNTVLANLHGTP
jgi:hypothetical protein